MKFPFAKSAKPAAPARQTLQATVARRASRASEIEEEQEPTTSFTTALVVMVVLHLVAAGGIFAFERIKMHRPHAFDSHLAPVASKAEPASAKTDAPAKAQTVAATKAVPAPTPSTTVKKTAPANPEVKDSGTTYTVAKGDSPVTIAKKHHVLYDDLLKLNQIDDPKKRRIGQKLRIPVKPRVANN